MLSLMVDTREWESSFELQALIPFFETFETILDSDFQNINNHILSRNYRLYHVIKVYKFYINNQP